MSIIIFGVGFLYWGEMYDYYDDSFELTYISIFMISNIICFVNLSRKNGIKRLLTILICSFAISLFWNIGYREEFTDNDLLYNICGLLFFFVSIPVWMLILLKLVWRDKPEDETENKDKNLVKRTRAKIRKK